MVDFSWNTPEDWPAELKEAYKRKLAEFWEENQEGAYEYPDNTRVARVGNAEEEAAFKKAEENGCCGSFEVEWDLGTPPVRVKYGFNYGH